MENKNSKRVAVLSASGGMDSTSLLLNLLAKDDVDKVYTVSFNYSQKHSQELKCIKKNIEYLKSKGYEVEHKELDVSFLGSMLKSSLTSKEIDVPIGFYNESNMVSTVIPNRNAIFSSIVFGYALSLSKQYNTQSYISLGIHLGDHDTYPDCRQEFRDAIDYAFKIGNWESQLVDYYTPYLEIDKAGILQDAMSSCKKLELDFNTIMSNTNTCYNPNTEGEACGKCGSCVERILAFNSLELIDPIKYQDSWEAVVTNALDKEREFKEKKD